MHLSSPRVVASLVVALAVAVSGLSAAPPPARAAGSVTALALDSEPGDNVGAGQQLEFTPPTHSFRIYTMNPGGLWVDVQGPESNDYWNLSIAAPGSEALAVGTYENAQAPSDGTHPLLGFGGQSRGCTSAASGRFV